MEPRSFKRGNLDGETRLDVLDHASMEPRSFKRGNACARRASAAQARRFNGATFIQTWKRLCPSRVRPCSSLLQWSHVHSNVETHHARMNAPRFTLASMEPRSFKRGNQSSSRVCVMICGFNGATFIQTWKHEQLGLVKKSTIKLQWSHVHSNVETEKLRQRCCGG